jgi:hypothetical protein
MARLVGVLSLLAVLPLAGCTQYKLDYEKQFDLSPQDKISYTMTVPPIKKEQVIKVSVTADNPVNVLIGLEKDEKALNDEYLKNKYTAKTMTKELKTQQASLQATVPANESAVVLVLVHDKKSNVKVRITN